LTISQIKHRLIEKAYVVAEKRMEKGWIKEI